MSESFEGTSDSAPDEIPYAIESSFLREGSAADLWLYQVRKTSVLLSNAGSDKLPNPMVKKVMRVAPEYFRNFGSSQDADLLLNLRKEFHDRFQLWWSLSHPNLVASYLVVDWELTLFQEYCENGDLREYLKKDLTEIDYIRVVIDVLSGIAYLHDSDPPIAHGYINPGKIYMRGQTAKLGEFGLSQLVADFPHLVPSIFVTGITRWMGPEYFDEVKPGVFTTQGDVWSFGCVLLEIFTGALPYHKTKYDTQVMANILGGLLPGNVESVSREGLSHKVKKFVQDSIAACWLPFGERPSAQYLLGQATQVLQPLGQELNITQSSVTIQPATSDTTAASYLPPQHAHPGSLVYGKNRHGSLYGGTVKLPLGLIYEIANVLLTMERANDLANLSLASRVFAAAVQPQLFRHIRVSTSDRCVRLKQALQSCDGRKCRLGRELAPLVRHLSVVLDPQAEPSLFHHLLELCERLPMLESFNLTEVLGGGPGTSLTTAEESLTRLGALKSIRSVILEGHLGLMGGPMLMSLPHLKELHLFGNIPASLFTNAPPRSGHNLHRLTWGATIPPTLQRIRWVFGESDEVTGGELVLFLSNPIPGQDAIAKYAHQRGMDFRVIASWK